MLATAEGKINNKETVVNRVILCAVLMLVAVTVCLGQSAPATGSEAPAADSGTATIHGVIPVSLDKALDSKKLKEGDTISAKTVVALHSSSGVDVPLGSTVVGHVTQAKSRSKGDSEAALGIAFDKIELPGGKEMPIKGALQAVGQNPKADSGPTVGAAGGNSLNSGNGSTAAAGTGLGLQPGQQPGQGKILGPHSTGVVGIKNLELNDSVLTSTAKEVKLDSGSQMMIKIE